MHSLVFLISTGKNSSLVFTSFALEWKDTRGVGKFALGNTCVPFLLSMMEHGTSGPGPPGYSEPLAVTEPASILTWESDKWNGNGYWWRNPVQVRMPDSSECLCSQTTGSGKHPFPPQMFITNPVGVLTLSSLGTALTLVHVLSNLGTAVSTMKKWRPPESTQPLGSWPVCRWAHPV
jgi:hypothetical protein